MIQIDRRIAIAVGVGAILALVLAFTVGRATAGSSAAAADASPSTTQASTTVPEGALSSTTTEVTLIDGDPAKALPPELDIPATGIPVYGSEADRDRMLSDLVAAGVIGGTREGILETADHVCFSLERLLAQDRKPSFAVRVVWNESLADLESEDLAAFGVVFRSAPRYLCPESVDYGERVAYWLGF